MQIRKQSRARLSLDTLRVETFAPREAPELLPGAIVTPQTNCAYTAFPCCSEQYVCP